MKPLESLNNVEKAKLLHELFPGEIPAFIEFAEKLCATIKEDEKNQRLQWTVGLISFDLWLSLISQTEKKIEQYGRKLQQNSKLFAEQLFDGYMAMYLNHCLLLYTNTRQHPNEKFTMAIDLFFKP